MRGSSVSTFPRGGSPSFGERGIRWDARLPSRTSLPLARLGGDRRGDEAGRMAAPRPGDHGGGRAGLHGMLRRGLRHRAPARLAAGHPPEPAAAPGAPSRSGDESIQRRRLMDGLLSRKCPGRTKMAPSPQLRATGGCDRPSLHRLPDLRRNPVVMEGFSRCPRRGRSKPGSRLRTGPRRE